MSHSDYIFYHVFRKILFPAFQEKFPNKSYSQSFLRLGENSSRKRSERHNLTHSNIIMDSLISPNYDKAWSDFCDATFSETDVGKF